MRDFTNMADAVRAGYMLDTPRPYGYDVVLKVGRNTLKGRVIMDASKVPNE